MRILLVEDDVQLARQIASALTEAGHDPIIVHDGERALDKAKETPFDLIVLDIILPGMDGFGVLRYLRSQHMASRVLMLTARGEVKDRGRRRLFAQAICYARTGGARARARAALSRGTGNVLARWRSYPRSGNSRRPPRRATHRAFATGAHVAKGADAGAWPCLHAHGALRACLGTRA